MKSFVYIVFLVMFLITCDAMDPRCKLNIEPGFCMGNMPKFGFDTTTQKCIEFVYGGCWGNANIFDSIEECQQVCGL